MEDAAKLTKKRWFIMAISCLISLTLGILYSWSVFAKPLCQEFGVADLSYIFTIANLVGPITMIPGGYINDRFGPRKLIFFGGLIYGLSLFLSGFAKSPGMLIVTYSLGVGLSMSVVYGCMIANSVKFFPDYRGLAGGIATASFGISGMVLPLLTNTLMEQFGVQASFWIMGVVFAVINCGGALFMEKCPDNFIPEGWIPPKREEAGTSSTDRASVNKTWKEMLQDSIFYIMLMMLTCGATCGLMIISNASVIAQNLMGMDAASAAGVVSVLFLFNTGGRIIAGYLSDRIGRIGTLRIAMVLALVGLFLLHISGKTAILQFYAGVGLVGFCFGTFMGVFPGFTADQFGPKYNTVNYGIMWIGFSLAGLVGPSILTSVYKATGGYQLAFLLAAAIASAGLVLSVIYSYMNRKRQIQGSK